MRSGNFCMSVSMKNANEIHNIRIEKSLLTKKECSEYRELLIQRDTTTHNNSRNCEAFTSDD